MVKTSVLNTKSPIGLRPLPEEWPVTSKFGEKRASLVDKLQLKASSHKGIDFGSKRNNSGKISKSIDGQQIRAYRDGKCSICHDNGDGYGLRIWVDHANRRDGYCHLKESFVSVGDTITQGQVIGLVGNSGKSSAAHLHFETRLDNVAVEPYFYTEEEHNEASKTV